MEKGQMFILQGASWFTLFDDEFYSHVDLGWVSSNVRSPRGKK